MNTAARALFLSLLATGCAHGIDFGKSGRLRDPNAVLQRARQAALRVTRLEAHAELSAHTPEQHGSVALWVAVQRPASLHVETLGFFGKPMTVLISDGTRFGFYDGKQDTFTTGPASPVNLARFLPVAVSGEDLVTLLLGGVPRASDPSPKLSVDEQARAYRVALSNPPERETLWIDPSSFRLVKASVADGVAYEATFSDFVGEAGTDFPRRLKMSVPRRKAELELRYTRITANGDVDPELFSTEPPEGVKVIRVDAAGRPVAGGALEPGDSGEAPPNSGPATRTG